MAESQDLNLLSRTGPKCRGDQSQKGNKKWRHRGNDDDLTNRVKACIFNPDGVFGIHRQPYVDEGAEAFEKRYQQQHIKGLAARAKELGYQLMPTTT